jgi:NAD(P)H-hydrate epimerase
MPIDRNLYTAEQTRRIDRAAIDGLGIPGIELMRRAAAAAFAALRRRWPSARRLVVLAGAGNNGGDAFLLGALALREGFAVDALALTATSTGDAGAAREAFVAAGGSLTLAGQGRALPDADVYVDGLFGSGLSRDIDGAARDLIEALNARRANVLALDVPSGLDADRGVPRGVAVRADATVCFAGWKCGLFTADGADCCGERELATLDIPLAAFNGIDAPAQRLGDDVFDALPPRRANSNKGSYGHVLVLGGDHGFGGAVRLCAAAALRSGAGLVSVATRAAHVAAFNAALPEAMARGVETTADLDALLARASVLALGPGLGQDEWSQALFDAALATAKPCVVDADALNLLARAACARCIERDHAASGRSRAPARQRRGDDPIRSFPRRARTRATLRRGRRAQGQRQPRRRAGRPHRGVSVGQSRHGQRRHGRRADRRRRRAARARTPGVGRGVSRRRRACARGRHRCRGRRSTRIAGERLDAGAAACPQWNRSMSASVTLPNLDEAALTALAQRLAPAMRDGAAIHLSGELGAGKTTFARALLKAIGVGERVKSPTYSLIESYQVGALDVHHLDLYRIADPGELEWLGLSDLAAPSALLLVEWPERGGDALPAPDLHVFLSHAGSSRDLEIQPTRAARYCWKWPESMPCQIAEQSQSESTKFPHLTDLKGKTLAFSGFVRVEYAACGEIVAAVGLPSASPFPARSASSMPRKSNPCASGQPGIHARRVRCLRADRLQTARTEQA